MKFIFLDIDGMLDSIRSVIAKVGPNAEHESSACLWRMSAQDSETRPRIGCETPIRTHRWPNCLVKLTPTLRLVPFSCFAPSGAAHLGR